jgi:4-hydroxythreonine-4-phosphate dehydrogenase
MNTLPLALTMGDALGIGPEILVRAFRDHGVRDAFVIGEPAVLRRAARVLRRRDDVPELPIAVIESVADLAAVPPGALPVRLPSHREPALADAPWGTVDGRCGRLAAACIRDAVALAQRGEIAGLVTAPIHKEALAAAGEPFPGHTELLAAESARHGQPADVRMMLANEELRTVLVTIHCALREAIERVTLDAVLSTLRISHAAAARWGQPAPRIAVAGLNPHAGEGGLFGREEIEIIAPAIAAARAEGIDARGPFPPDTVFMRARRGEFDLVLAMYHDQGLIPVKYLGVEQGVNVTLGLPFVRTSPDHGTAFDIAGRGVAEADSLLAALAMARRLTEGAPAVQRSA